MKKVIVTGANGFIGRHLIAEIARRFGGQCQVHAAARRDVDLTDQAKTFEYFKLVNKDVPCDHIFHLAALYRPGDWSVRHPATQFFANMAININVLEAWSRFCPEARLTSTLSYAIYPDHDRPHAETEAYGSEPEETLFAYAFAKKALLVGQKAYQKEFGLKSASVVFPTVFGPEGKFGDGADVVNAFIMRFHKAVSDRASEVEIWGSGRQKREFLYISDAIDGLLAVAAKGTSPFYNLGTGKSETIIDLAGYVAKATGYSGKIVANPQKFEGTAKREMDIALIKNELGWQPAVSVIDGIKLTVDWYDQRFG